MNIFEALVNLLFESGDLAGYDYQLVVFSLGAAFMGAILILLDWLSFVLIDRSFFNLNHGSGSLRFILLWGIAAGIGGYLGAAAEIFKISRFGCIAAGMAGSLILPRLNDLFSSKEDIETPQGRRVT